MEYTVEREGDVWLYVFPVEGVGAQLDQVGDGRDGPHAEITIALLAQAGQLGGHVHQTRLNLLSTSGRETILKHLKGKNALGIGSVPINWEAILEVCCTRTTREYREGTPLVDLSRVVVPTGNRYLLHPLLPVNETTVLFGPGGSMKSVMALGAGGGLRSGHALPGTKFDETLIGSNVLYFDWESNEVEHAERLAWLAAGWGLAEAPQIYYRQMHRSVRADAPRLAQLRAQVKAELVIYDSLAGASGGDLNDADVATATLSAMRYVGGTRLVVAHETKANAERKEGTGSIFGSVFFENYARSVWEVRAGDDREQGEAGPTGPGASGMASVPEPESERVLGLFNRKVNRGRLWGKPLVLAVCWQTWPVRAIRIIPGTLGSDAVVDSYAPLSARLHQLLMHGPRTASQLGEELSADRKSVDTTLRRMGSVIQLRRGAPGHEAEWGLRA